MHVSDSDITSLSSEIAMSISHSVCDVSTWMCVCASAPLHILYCKTAAQSSYVHGLPVTFPVCCSYAWRVSETERSRGKARVRKTGNHFSLWEQWSGEACRWNPIFLWLSPLKIFHLSVPASWRLPPSQSAECVCWLCIAVIYIGHWQHHLLTNVLHFWLLPSWQTTSTRSPLSLSLSLSLSLWALNSLF